MAQQPPAMSAESTVAALKNHKPLLTKAAGALFGMPRRSGRPGLIAGAHPSNGSGTFHVVSRLGIPLSIDTKLASQRFLALVATSRKADSLIPDGVAGVCGRICEREEIAPVD